jgi:hypothetical protein
MLLVEKRSKLSKKEHFSSWNTQPSAGVEQLGLLENSIPKERLVELLLTKLSCST